jgi:hypothetical protein
MRKLRRRKWLGGVPFQKLLAEAQKDELKVELWHVLALALDDKSQWITGKVRAITLLFLQKKAMSIPSPLPSPLPSLRK